VVQAEAAPDQLAEGVELFGDQLSGAQHGDRPRSVPGDQVGKAPCRAGQGVIPGDGDVAAGAVSEQRDGEPAGCRDGVVFGESLGTQAAPVDRMVGVTPDSNRLAVPYAEFEAAADRAVPAGGFDPAIRGAGPADHAGPIVVGVAVVLGPRPEPEEAHRIDGHRRPRKKEPSAVIGTTVT
jgi:hypothetical protein